MGQRILLMDDSALVVEAVREALECDNVNVEDAVDLTTIDPSELDRFDSIEEIRRWLAGTLRRQQEA